MTRHDSIGLDELMIVNPGRPGSASNADYFLGEDGKVYQVQGIEYEPSDAGLSGFYLGDDGRLYHLHGLQALAGLAGARRLPRRFLGEDGTLYEMRKDNARGRGGQ